MLNALTNNMIVVPILLSHEKSFEAIDRKRLNNRIKIIQELQRVDSEWLGLLRHFQPQTGCFNKCGFCSQHTSSIIYELSLESIEDIVSAIKTIGVRLAIEEKRIDPKVLNDKGQLNRGFIMPKMGLVSYNTLSHPGIVYLYLDNDPSLYPHLDKLIELLYNDLGVRSRISTVGFSKQSDKITSMYQRICGPLQHMVAGIRLSLSEYAYGFKNTKYTSREQFEDDFAHTLRIFKKQLMSPSQGFCIELRFRPLVHACKLDQCVIGGHQILKCGEYLLISQSAEELPPLANLVDTYNHNLSLDKPGIKVWQCILSPTQETNWRLIAKEVVNCEKSTKQYNGKLSTLHRLANEDGVYYGLDVKRFDNGFRYSRYFYPKTVKRPASGYINGERFLLNEMLNIMDGRHELNWSDVDRVIERLRKIVDQTRETEPIVGAYINSSVLPLTTVYIKALKKANFSASCFFDRNISVETGHICNLGRGYIEYKEIASRADLPMTLHHERTFGIKGDLSLDGIAYRIAPGSVRRPSSKIKSTDNSSIGGFTIETLNLSLTATASGQSEKRIIVNIGDILVKPFDLFSQTIPGQMKFV